MVKQLSSQRKTDIISALNNGESIRRIATRMGIGYGTVQRIAKQKNLTNLKKVGRPKKLTNRMNQFIEREIQKKGVSSVSLAKTIQTSFGMKVSRQTVARSLKSKNYKAVEKKKKPSLSKKNIKLRLEFARKHKEWTVDDWKRVIWSDESKICRFNSEGRSWSWIRDGEDLPKRSITQTVKFGGGSIMVWGCMTAEGIGYLTKIDSTRLWRPLKCAKSLI